MFFSVVPSASPEEKQRESVNAQKIRSVVCSGESKKKAVVYGTSRPFCFTIVKIGH